jgi:hypothetical protein
LIVPDEGYYLIVSDEGYYLIVPDEDYRTVSESLKVFGNMAF